MSQNHSRRIGSVGSNRSPQQRGIRRIAALLDAATAILAEKGYEAASLKAIGERAGIPTASVYHYFSDRQQLEHELITRHLGELEANVSEAMSNLQATNLSATVDSALNPLLSYFRENPSCVVLWFSVPNQATRDLIRDFDGQLAQHIWRISTEQGLLAPDTPLRVVQLAVAAATSLVDIAFYQVPGGDKETIHEMRRMVTAYLATYAG